MAKKGLFSQFVNSWVRQMGRESAHTAYGDITGKNTRESFSDVKELRSFPAVWDYIKLLLAQWLLFIGPLWAIIKGLRRLFGKKIQYVGVVDKNIYKLDRRYSDNQRYVGTEEVKLRLERLKEESPEKDVKKYNTHAIVYIVIGAICLVCQSAFLLYGEKQSALEKAELASYTKWHSVTITDDFTGQSSSYEMLYPTLDSVATDKVILFKQKGTYFLLSTSASLFNVDYSTNLASVDIKTTSSVKTIELKKDTTESTEYMTPFNKVKKYPVRFIIPSGVIPSKGQILIRSKESIYSFDLDKE